MSVIGGIFPFETALSVDNGYFQRICPPDGDISFMMSGRCGIFRCLQDICQHDNRKVAYVPIYTCETVLAPFEKAGYQLKFYELDENLHSIFDERVLDEISVLSLCGYYGFCSYDHDFVRACKDRGIVIFEDVTHSLLSSDGIDPLCDYAAGSFRKWMGVSCGGFAMKRKGKFTAPLLPVDAHHLELRDKAISQSSGDVFWEGELLLRKMFDSFGSDDRSEFILRHADLKTICSRRRENFAAILQGLPDNLSGFRPVFPVLTPEAVPSHFTLYADDRDGFRQYLDERGVHSTVYWPVGPLVDLTGHDTAKYIYDHIVALPCDQRYTASDMARIAEVLTDYSEHRRNV